MEQGTAEGTSACVCMLSHLSCLTLCDPMSCSPPRLLCPWGFSKQEYWKGLSRPPSGDLPNSGIQLVSLLSPALAGGFFTTSATWEARGEKWMHLKPPLSQGFLRRWVICTAIGTLRCCSWEGDLVQPLGKTCHIT